MFKFNSIIDVLSLLFSSIALCLKSHRFDKSIDVTFVNLLNFISGTKFHESTFKTFQEVRQFVFDNSNFSYIITLDTKDLSLKTPLDFYLYLEKKFAGNTTKIMDKFDSTVVNIKSRNLTSKISDKIKNITDKLFVYYFFQKLSYINDDIKILFEEKVKTTTFKNHSKTTFGNPIEDFDYLSGLHIPTATIGCDFFAYNILLYTGPFELTSTDRQDLLALI